MIMNSQGAFLIHGGTPMLLTARYVLSVPWGDVPTGRYYWEHCLYMDRIDWPNDAQMGLAVRNIMGLIYSSTVQLHGCRWYLPNTTTVYFQQVYTFPQFGGQPAAVGYDILYAARWRMKTALGVRSYHLHRQPMPASYVQDGKYTALGRAQSQIRINTFIAQAKYRASNGALLTSGSLAPEIASWQLRHGTKRKARRSWLP